VEPWGHFPRMMEGLLPLSLSTPGSVYSISPTGVQRCLVFPCCQALCWAEEALSGGMPPLCSVHLGNLF
jgi:hypothetical protein